jgi:REP element-mobilizing transposase RayT
MVFNPEIHHRRSVRLRDYDYSCAGAYFVTICAYERECLFGDVVDGEVQLTPVGEIVRDEWMMTGKLRDCVVLDEFIVMPNHFHAVLMIDHVGAIRRIAPTAGPASGSIGAIIGQFKSAATKRINQFRDNPGGPVWQRNYYERVIRADRELEGIRRYIAANPAKWEEDENHPTRQRTGA